MATGFYHDKVVWITGASSGIGEALAYALSAEGAKLVLSARQEERLAEVGRKCKGDAEDILIVPMDLSRVEEIPAIASKVMAKWQRVDYMIHNAGIASRDLVENTELKVYRQVMETNFFGTVALTKAILPPMQQAGKGNIVVLLSLSAKFGVPLLSAYAASKHALTGFFESLRAEVENRGIGIHLMIPGFINTPILMHAVDGQGKVKGRNLAVNENGMDPGVCADQILRAVRKGRKEATIGFSASFSVTLHRFMPNVSRKLVRSHPLKWLRKHFPWFVK